MFPPDLAFLLQPLTLTLTLALASAAALLLFAAGTAHAAPKSPGGRPGAKGGGPSGKKGSRKGSREASGKKGGKAGTSGPPHGNTRLPKGWPEWRFQPGGTALERAHREADELVRRGATLEAAEAWDRVRAVARLSSSPGGLRYWCALSRCARALSDSTEEPGGDGELPEVETAARLVGAAALASACLQYLPSTRSAAYALRLASVPSAPGGAPGSAAGVLGKELAAAMDAEHRFAFETAELSSERLKWSSFPMSLPPLPASDDFSKYASGLLGSFFHLAAMMGGGYTENAADGTTRVNLPASLSESLYPKYPSKLGLPWHTPDYLRRLLADEEGPKGPGPGSRDALLTRSELGESLYDTGRTELEKEALELLREASLGLDASQGPRDRESLVAKERWARRMAGLFGTGRILARGGPEPLPGEMRRAAALLRDVASLAEGLRDGDDYFAPGRYGPELRLTARITLARVTGKLEGPEQGFLKAQSVLDEREALAEVPRGETAMARILAEAAECARGNKLYGEARDLHLRALALRRERLGWRHPETAASLAAAGDLAELAGEGAAPGPFWALALEALAEAGEELAPDRAELSLRLGRWLTAEGEPASAVLLLEPALAWAGKARGLRDRLTFRLSHRLVEASLASGARVSL
ncbi:MAG: tetratricopeptide repeat protein [Deltaproteobacteria bacterium]|nr:tetratricopeptide repeat protein [Deltaproteobacteria bacterium]